MVDRRFETEEERESTDILAECAETEDLPTIIEGCRSRGKAVDLERANVYEAELMRRRGELK